MQQLICYTADVEVSEPGGAETSEAVDRSLHSILETTSQHYGHTVRSIHAKSHGSLGGTLTIRDGLAPELAQGIAALPGKYESIMRLSPTRDILSDSIGYLRVLLRVSWHVGEIHRGARTAIRRI